MSDLIERLRKAEWAALTRQLCNEAADELAQQRLWIERLEFECKTMTDVAEAHIDDNDILIKRNAKLEAVLEEIVNFDHDQDCLPACGREFLSCDSIMHEELCPFCNPELVMCEIAKEALSVSGKRTESDGEMDGASDPQGIDADNTLQGADSKQPSDEYAAGYYAAFDSWALEEVHVKEITSDLQNQWDAYEWGRTHPATPADQRQSDE